MTMFCHYYASQDSTNTAVVTRWYDGLINKDISITNEIYSLGEVEFDRQVSSATEYTYNCYLKRANKESRFFV